MSIPGVLRLVRVQTKDMKALGRLRKSDDLALSLPRASRVRLHHVAFREAPTARTLFSQLADENIAVNSCVCEVMAPIRHRDFGRAVDLGPDQLVLKDHRSVDHNVNSWLLRVEIVIRGRCRKDESLHGKLGGDKGTQDAS
jgi:hypothetical protein